MVIVFRDTSTSLQIFPKGVVFSICQTMAIYNSISAKLLSTLNAKCCSKYAGITSLQTEHKAYKSPRSICTTNMHKEYYSECAN